MSILKTKCDIAEASAMQLQWFLGNEYCGEAFSTSPWSLAYFCPACGDIYCRAVGPNTWSIYTIPCWRHRSHIWCVSYITDWSPRYWETVYPQRILIHDFLNLMEALDQAEI